jgi:hypothetical protein
MVRNLGDSVEAIDLTLRDGANNVLMTIDDQLLPGTSAGIAYPDDVLGGNCIFEFDGDPARMRGAIFLSEAVNGPPVLHAAAFEAPDGPIQSAETVTPPVRSVSGGVLQCRVQNLSAEPVSVMAELVDETGAVLFWNAIDALPQQVMTVISTTATVLGGYCRFRFDANPAQVRGYLTTRLALSGIASRHVLRAEPAALQPTVAAVSPAVAGAAGDATTCVVQNLHHEPVDVQAELVDRFGNELVAASKTVAPNAVQSITGTTESAAHAVCRFTFPEKGIAARGFLSQFPSGLFSDTRLLEAASTVQPGFATRPQTTYTAPVLNTDRQLQCVVVNRTTATVAVDIEVTNSLSGAILATGDILAPPGQAGIAYSTVMPVPGGVCRFDFDVSSDLLSGAAMLTNLAGTRTFLQVPAEPLGPLWTPTPTATATATSTPRPTFTFTATATPASTATPSTTATPTVTPSATNPPTATPTPTPSGVPTASPTSEPTATATAASTGTSSPLPSATPGVAATSTPTHVPAPACVGDCNGDGAVTVDEIITMVSVALGEAGAECGAGDRDGDGEITVDEILAAIDHALNGC